MFHKLLLSITSIPSSLYWKGLLATSHSMKKKFSGNVFFASLIHRANREDKGHNHWAYLVSIIVNSISKLSGLFIECQEQVSQLEGVRMRGKSFIYLSRNTTFWYTFSCLPGPAHISSLWRHLNLLRQRSCYSFLHFPTAFCQCFHYRMYYNVLQLFIHLFIHAFNKNVFVRIQW